MATANFRVATEEKQNIQNEILLRIANKMGAFEEPMSWAAIQEHVRAGTVGMLTSPGEQLEAEMAEIVSATVYGEGITAATVSKDTFLEAAGTHAHEYEFAFDGAAWHYNGSTVALADYGITPTGTAVSGDVIVVHRTATTHDFDVQGIDEDVPVDPLRSHVLAIQMHKVLRTLNFDPPQYLLAVTAESLAALGISGTTLPAGTYNVTLNHGAANGGTAEDGTYQFTTTKAIPVGGGIRHSYMGTYQSSSGDYGKAKVLAGTFITYDADTLTTLDAALETTEGNDGINLGTTTANDPQYKSGDFINFTQRQRYGSNRWSTSFMRLYLNSAEATVTFKRGTIWSRNNSAEVEGFLHTIDPELRAVLGKVRKRYALPIADGYGYEDVEDTVSLNTFLDCNGGKNNNISEGPVDAAGNVTRTTAYSLWKPITTNAQRIKYQGNSAAIWWLGSCNPSNASSERFVNASGAFNNNFASNACGVVPSLYII